MNSIMPNGQHISNTNGIAWISHRGIRRDAAENTRQSFDQAVDKGFHYLETDLRLTSDGSLVLSHDESVSRLTGVDRKVSSYSREELSTLKLSHGCHFLFFDDFMKRYAEYRWVFDIKPEGGDQTIRRLCDWAQASGCTAQFQERAYFLFWAPGHEELLLQRLPQAKIFAGEKECWRAGLSVFAGVPIFGGVRPGRSYAVPPSLGPMKLFNKRIPRTFRSCGSRSIAYLPRSLEQAKQAKSAGFDFIISDDWFSCM